MDDPELQEPLIGREDDLDDANYQTREVYAQYGLTSYFSQVMEKGVLNTIVLKATAMSRQPGTEVWDVLFAKYAKLSLGQLLTTFRNTFPDESEVLQALNDALPLRNFVAHSFFWDRAASFMSFSGREQMLTELIAARELFQSTDALVSALIRRVAAEHGMDGVQFEERLGEAMEELRSEIPAD